MTKIQLRRDTAANWSTNNPTPSAGEPCFETDTGKLKIGDGITAYNSLPYQGGTGDVTSAGNNTFTGTNIFKGKSLNVGDDNNYADIASFSGTTYTVGDQKDTTIVNPLEIGASNNNTVLKSNVRVLETDTASSTKKAYSIMTKSPANNEYMSGLAMPSKKRIDLTLGASGSTYTAPANGWFFLGKATGRTDHCFVQLYHSGKINAISHCSNGTTEDEVICFLPAKKGDVIGVNYTATGAKTVFKFVYAEGEVS